MTAMAPVAMNLDAALGHAAQHLLRGDLAALDRPAPPAGTGAQGARRSGIVTGPSLTSATCMSAPNSPVATRGCRARARATKCSYSARP